MSSGSYGLGIDTGGDVVGYDTLNSGVNHAFFYSNATSTMYDLNALLAGNPNSVVLNVAYGINDNGSIVAYGAENNTVHAFLLTQVTASSATPEPAPLALLVPGIALVGAVTGRRRKQRSTTSR